jgi:TRAP-type C4-dicarboxylate transport system permease small subunit
MAILDEGPDAPAPIRWLGRAVDWTVVLMGMLMVTLVFANVLMHNLLDRDVALTTELCELLMVWVTLLGGASAARRGSHMAITELIDRLGGRLRQIIEILIESLVLVTLGLLTWYGVGITQAGMSSVLIVLQWPMAAQYAALPVASAITMVFVGWDLFAIFQQRTRTQRFGGEGEPA